MNHVVKKIDRNANFKKIIIFISLILFNIGFLAPLFSTDYYWEKPITISKTDSRFPITITNGKDSYVFWEEVDTSRKE